MRRRRASLLRERERERCSPFFMGGGESDIHTEESEKKEFCHARGKKKGFATALCLYEWHA